MLIYDIISILPYWAFLLFHDPHDCFKCLGKDPERNYSMFQFNRAELLKLRYCAKFGSRETLTSTIDFNRATSTRLWTRRPTGKSSPRSDTAYDVAYNKSRLMSTTSINSNNILV